MHPHPLALQRSATASPVKVRVQDAKAVSQGLSAAAYKAQRDQRARRARTLGRNTGSAFAGRACPGPWPVRPLPGVQADQISTSSTAEADVANAERRDQRSRRVAATRCSFGAARL